MKLSVCSSIVQGGVKRRGEGIGICRGVCLHSSPSIEATAAAATKPLTRSARTFLCARAVTLYSVKGNGGMCIALPCPNMPRNSCSSSAARNSILGKGVRAAIGRGGKNDRHSPPLHCERVGLSCFRTISRTSSMVTPSSASASRMLSTIRHCVPIHDAVMKKRKSAGAPIRMAGRTPAITAARTPRRFAFYFSDNASPLKSRLTIRPFCSPVSVSTAPLWLARTTACAPFPAAAPAPPWA
jgi:hypothetical protein